LPSELAQLHFRDGFDVAHNRLSGTIPTEFNNILVGGVFRINDNYFTGTIPPLMLNGSSW
jgi:hypothetical protein